MSDDSFVLQPAGVEDSAESGVRTSTPRCANHPDRQARSSVCKRCGNYACDACFSPGDDDFCAACEEWAGLAPAWERRGQGGVLQRLFRTCIELGRAPYERFSHIGDGDLGRALSFTATLSIIGFGTSLFLLCSACFLVVGLVGALEGNSGQFEGNQGDLLSLSLQWAEIVTIVIVLGPLLLAAFNVVSRLLYGSVYHAAAKLAGGEASYSSSLRAAQYQSASTPIVRVIPGTGVPIFLGWWGSVGSVVGAVLAMKVHATGQHRLRGATAWLVAAVPPLFVVPATIVLLVTVMLVVFRSL